ncbi:hypothetical protein TREMEDRAFT_65024, partial [Tremella mesenterica DSM 1558]|uniref:uncharacterized protein n=1 Tax=Tremella mesenterica (strain ATCC 24925 / CBS 8224 / DSM 1558 / NBRC 9311 / NRRL Y-6157 / RJB 2259-6 / UBC 559-6) TaxID=578456 RepID=UPI00032C3DE2
MSGLFYPAMNNQNPLNAQDTCLICYMSFKEDRILDCHMSLHHPLHVALHYQWDTLIPLLQVRCTPQSLFSCVSGCHFTSASHIIMMAHAASHPRIVLYMTGARINNMEQHFVEPHLPLSQHSEPLQHLQSEFQWDLYKVDIRTSGRVVGCQYNFRHKVTGQCKCVHAKKFHGGLVEVEEWKVLRARKIEE